MTEERIAKTTLIDNMRRGYDALEALLASLHAEQVTEKGVNGEWSVKDNIAHIIAWQRREIRRVEAIKYHTVFDDPFPTKLNIDEINDYVYQQNKDRSFTELLAELLSSYRKLEDLVQTMTDEQLNQPHPWRKGALVWQTIAGNTYEHYEEHATFIQNWLARSRSV